MNTDYSEKLLVIGNIVIPMRIDETFIPPDMEGALRYYPFFIRHSGLDWPIQAYLSAIMKEIDKREPNGYTGDTAVKEYVQYYGLRHFCEHLKGPISDEEWSSLFAPTR